MGWLLAAAAIVATASTAYGGAFHSSITGLGATDADWNRTHVADHRYAPGHVYDPDPSAPSGDEYDAVEHEGHRVIAYDYRFKGRPISRAKALVLSTEFPRDAHVVWFVSKVKTGCAQMLVRSAALGRALAKKPIGDKTGTGFVEFASGATGDTYSPRSVTEAIVQVFPLVARSSAPPC